MAKLSEEVKAAVAGIKPGLVATASKSGTPNVSAKGSFRVLDDDHVLFALVKSPQTYANLKENPQVHIICLDPATRKGCRIAGKAELVTSGPLFEQISKEFAERKMVVQQVAKVAVDEAYAF